MESIKQNKKLIYTALFGGLFLILLASLAVYIFNDKPNVTNENEGEEDITYQVVAESGDAVLMADTGLNVEWLVDEDDGRRAIFERYRVVKKEQFDNFTGAEAIIDSIDISSDNAEVLLTYPDGTQDSIANDTPYVLLQLLPKVTPGLHTLTIRLNSGEDYAFVFERPALKEEEFIRTNTTKLVNSTGSEIDEILGLSADRDLHGFKLGNMDLNEADKAFYITPDGSALGGSLSEAKEAANIDEYFWVDLELLEALNKERQNNISILETQEELSEKEKEYLERIKDPEARRYIFLANVDGVWHYAIAYYPDDF